MPEQKISDAAQLLELYYRENVRLSDRCVTYVNSSFEDIKLYGAAATVFAWPPLVNAIVGKDVASSAVAGLFDPRSTLLFLGFAAIHLLVTIIGISTLTRQSLVRFYLQHLTELESYINALLASGETFVWASRYDEWRRDRIMPVIAPVVTFCLLLVLVAPVAILLLSGAHILFVALYVFHAILLDLIYLRAVKAVFPEAGMRSDDIR